MMTRASTAVQEFSADDEQEETSVEEFVACSAWSSLSLILETQNQSPTITKKKERQSSINSNSGSEKCSQQSRWKLRKRKVVLYDQEMIDGDTSMEGLVDEDMLMSRKRNIKSRKLMRKLRPMCKSDSSGTLAVVAPDSENTHREKEDHGKKIVEINEDTPRRSARCCKLSKKLIQIKEERHEETDHKKDASQYVAKKKGVSKVKTCNNNHEKIQKAYAGLRRSSRIKKPTTEIFKFRKELKEDVYDFEDCALNVEKSGRYLQTSKKKSNLSEIPGGDLEMSQVPLERMMSSHNITEDMLLNCTDLPPPVRRKVFMPPADDGTTIIPRQARKLCNIPKTAPLASDHEAAVQVRPTEELLADSRHPVDENPASPLSAARSPPSLKVKKLVVLTESEEEGDDQDDQLFPAALIKPMENPRDWNCFQCVYELSKLDDRLTISDLDPLLEKKVDGDALLKSSLSDLVNVVGLEYSPAVRVIFLVQQILARDTSGKGGNSAQ